MCTVLICVPVCMVLCTFIADVWLGFPDGSTGKESACNVGDQGSIPGLERSPGEGNATHCSVLAWRIPWTTVHGVALDTVKKKGVCIGCYLTGLPWQLRG